VCILNFSNLSEFLYTNNRIEMSLQMSRFIDEINTSSNDED
jgi:hypothetical protein